MSRIGEARPSKRLARAGGGRGLRPTEFPPDSRPRYCRCEDERERWDSGEGRCVKCGKTIRLRRFTRA